jgi:hypothetical protein
MQIGAMLPMKKQGTFLKESGMKNVMAICLVGFLALAAPGYADVITDFTYTITLNDDDDGTVDILFNDPDDTGTQLNDNLTKPYYRAEYTQDVHVEFKEAGTLTINVVLGQVYALDQISLRTMTGRFYGTIAPHSVDIKGSVDGTTWFDVANWSNPVIQASDAYDDKYYVQSSGALSSVTAKYLAVTLGISTWDSNNKKLNIDEMDISGTTVPEPGTIALSLAGAGLMIRRKR